MSLNFDLIGRESAPLVRSWTSTDTLLYALAVGAGADPARDELAFTTENSQGVPQQVLPTFGVLAAHVKTDRKLGDFERARLVHAEQSFLLHRDLPVEGELSVTSTVLSMEDKGSGALVTIGSSGRSIEDGAEVVSATSAVFIRGEGGFGTRETQVPAWEVPERRVDATVRVLTRPDQALLYRLTGDRNPLHSDPATAARGGFARPILHGLCTYGITGRVLLHEVCGGDPTRFGGMSARFSRPVLPGEALIVSLWEADGETLFRTATDDGEIVIDRGRFIAR